MSPRTPLSASLTTPAFAGHERLRITAAVNPGGTPDCIWALAVLSDGFLVSGSSGGVVQVWDTQFGTLFSRAQHHKADVTCVAATPDGESVFAGGVDPKIIELARGGPLGGADGAAFRLRDQRRHHTGDIKALAMVAVRRGAAAVPFLVSGGDDADLLVHVAESFGRVHPVRVCPAASAPLVAVGGGRLAAAREAQLDVWNAAAASPEVRASRPCCNEEICSKTSTCKSLKISQHTFTHSQQARARAAVCGVLVATAALLLAYNERIRSKTPIRTSFEPCC